MQRSARASATAMPRRPFATISYCSSTLRRNLRGQRASFRERLLEHRVRRAELPVEIGPLAGDVLFGRLQRRFRRLERRAQVVRRHHQLQHLILDALDVALRRLDLVLHRVVFAVGLHFHQLVFVAGEAGVDGGEVFLEGAAAGLVGGLLLVGSGHRGARPIEFLVEGALCFRDAALQPSCLRGARVERLEADQSVQIWVHSLRTIAHGCSKVRASPRSTQEVRGLSTSARAFAP